MTVRVRVGLLRTFGCARAEWASPATSWAKAPLGASKAEAAAVSAFGLCRASSAAICTSESSAGVRSPGGVSVRCSMRRRIATKRRYCSSTHLRKARRGASPSASSAVTLSTRVPLAAHSEKSARQDCTAASLTRGAPVSLRSSRSMISFTFARSARSRSSVLCTVATLAMGAILGMESATVGADELDAGLFVRYHPSPPRLCLESLNSLKHAEKGPVPTGL